MPTTEKRGISGWKLISLSLLYIFSALLSFGVSFQESAKLTLAVSWTTLVGVAAWLVFQRQVQICLIQVCGIGLGLGLAIVAAASIFFGSQQGFLIVTIAAAVVFASRSKFGVLKYPQVSKFSQIDALIVGYLPIFSVVPFHPTIAALAFPLLLALAMSRLRAKILGTSGLFMGSLILMFSLLLHFTSRSGVLSSMWVDLINQDVVFDQSQSYAVAKNGLSGSLSILNEPLTGHFFAHAAWGPLQRIFGIDPFLLAGIGGFYFSALGITAIAHSQLRRASTGFEPTFIGLASAMFGASAIYPILLVQGFRAVNMTAMLWFACALCIFLASREFRPKLHYLLLFFATCIAFLGKIHYGITFLVFVFSSLLIKYFPRRPSKQAILESVVFLSGGVGTFFLTQNLRDGVSFELGLHKGVAVSALAFLLVRVIALLDFQSLASRSAQLATVMTSFVVSVIWVLFGGAFETNMLLMPLPIILTLGVLAGRAVEEDSVQQEKPFTTILLLLGLVAGTVIMGFKFRINRFDQRTADLLFVFPGIITMGLFLMVVALIGIWSSRQRTTRLLGRRVFAASLSLGMFFGVGLRPFVDAAIWDYKNFPDSSLDDDKIAIGEWLSKRVDGDEIIATNSMCRSELRVGYPVPTNQEESDCKGRNRLTWISALSAGQVLIEAPSYGPLSYRRVDKQEFVFWHQLSMKFGDSGDPRALRDLRGLGVRWFVVDKAVSSNIGWIPRDATEVDVGDFLVVDLSKV